MTLSIKNLQASVAGKPILKGIDLEIGPGEIHVLMGPNGSGKSTLANVLMGHPAATNIRGNIIFEGQDLVALKPHERSRAGLFLAFQYPVALPGITVGKFLKAAAEHHLPEGQKKVNISKLLKEIREKMKLMNMEKAFINRYLNDGFSGGEKKKLEVLQMMLLKPKLALVDEIDSGLDIDALKIVSKGFNQLRDKKFSALLITHYQRILDYIQPDKVHVMVKGRVAATGGPEMVGQLEAEGYDKIIEKAENQKSHKRAELAGMAL